MNTSTKSGNIQARTGLYAFLRIPVKLGAGLFFRKITLSGISNFPKNKPVILVANHQNAMLDPVLACLFLPKQLHWLTRADVFKKPAVNKLLRKLNMLPVYRERDKVPHLHALNTATFNEAYDRLAGNAVVCVFPEGTHRGKKQLFSLKKGVARMAVSVIERNIDDAVILPVGLDYENYYDYRKDIVIKVGKPIKLENYSEQIQSDPAKAQISILADIRVALQSVMIDIQHEEVYPVLIHLRELCYQLNASKTDIHQFEAYHSFCERAASDKALTESIKTTGRQYMHLSKELGIHEAYYASEPPLLNLALSVLMFPLVLPGIAFFYPVYLLAEFTQQKLVKDPLFINSIRLVVWTFITPLWLLIAGALTYLLSGSIYVSLLAVSIIILSGLLSLEFAEMRKRWIGWRRVNKAKNTMFEKFQSWYELRKNLSEIITKKER